MVLSQAAQYNFEEYGNLIEELGKEWEVPAVYKRISLELEGNSGLLGEVCHHILASQGKGLRPLLVLVCSHFGFLEQEEAILLAAAMEMLHTAMLIHDDIVDASPLRRGRDSVNYRWNDNVAVLAGDFLYGKSLEMVSQFGAEAVTRFAFVIRQACSGEFRQLETAFDTSLDVLVYEEIIRKKTAVMLANCCAIGGAVSGVRDTGVRALERYGLNLGMAFQIRDDVGDWCYRDEKPGKPVTHDLNQGVMTLPVLYVLESSPYKDRIGEIIAKKKFSGNNLDFIRREIQKNGALEFSLNIAEGYLEKSCQFLDCLPDIRGKEALYRLAVTGCNNLPTKTR